MNRSVLLVICDFLILTLLSFVRFDSVESTAPAELTPVTSEVSAPAMSNMVATLEAVLEAERSQREALTNALATQSLELEERLRLLAERGQHLASIQERLSESEAEARRLAEERARLERMQTEALATLNRALEQTERSRENLQVALSDTTREAAEAKARLQALEEELAKRREESEAMQQRIAQLDQTREALSEEKQQLALELRQTETEARLARHEVTNLSQQLNSASQEKAQLIETASRLATNVGSLSQESSALREQVTRQAEEATAIREQIERNIRLPANAIYGDFLSNRVSVATAGTTRGGFGQQIVRRREGTSVFVRHDGRVYAVLHLEAMPLRIWPPEAPWTGFTVELSHQDAVVSAAEFALLRRDPRVIFVPVDPSIPERMGVRIYDAATDVTAFADAVVVGDDGKSYGECSFRLKPGTPGYVEMERSTIRRWMGDFSPRRGNLAFTRTGLFMGILVNSDHCLLIQDVELSAPLRCNERLDPSASSAVLRTAQATLDRMPSSLR